MSVFNNLSGSKEHDVEVPFRDTMVYNLKLKDETTGEYLELGDSTFTLEVFLGNTIKFKTSGQLSEDQLIVTFTRETNLSIQIYGYRIRQTKDNITTTTIRGKFKVS